LRSRAWSTSTSRTVVWTTTRSSRSASEARSWRAACQGGPSFWLQWAELGNRDVWSGRARKPSLDRGTQPTGRPTRSDATGSAERRPRQAVVRSARVEVVVVAFWRNRDTLALSDRTLSNPRRATNVTRAGTARPRRARCRPSEAKRKAAGGDEKYLQALIVGGGLRDVGLCGCAATLDHAQRSRPDWHRKGRRRTRARAPGSASRLRASARSVGRPRGTRAALR